jgi:hypothetical protein
MEAGKPFQPVAVEPDCVCDPCPVVTEVAEEEDAALADEAIPAEEEEAEEVASVGTEGDPFAAAILAQEAATDVEPVVTEPAVVAPEATAWTPNIAGANWGVRLVSVVPGSSPPQAVLGLSNGESKVVRAGDMLPSAGVVVIAIGRDRVQLAQVKPAGDHAIVESIQLNAMYPSAQP